MEEIKEALVIAGHGSTVNKDSGRPIREHAERIRQRGLFAEVRKAFWKEQPSYRVVMGTIKSKRIFIVPFFLCEGYFTREVLPREFGVEGALTERDGRQICYCPPLGLHEYMTEALLKSAQNVLAGTPVDPSQTALILAGHGTEKNRNSTELAHRQAKRISELGIYAHVSAAFMEEAPFIKDWDSLTDCANVVVVPYFLSDGLHSYEDVPVLLGISADPMRERFSNPTHLRGRRVWYARAVGTEPRVAEVIVAQVEAFRRQYLVEDANLRC